MLRKTMIVLAKAAALTSGLTVEAFAHGDAEGMRGPRCGWLRVKLVAPTSQAAALFYGRLFEIAPAVTPLVTRRYDGTRLQADGDAGRCGQQSWQSRSSVAGGERSCQATRRLWREGSRLTRPLARRCCGRWSRI